jgi:hypothetical protein
MVHLKGLLANTMLVVISSFVTHLAVAQSDLLAQADVTRIDPVIVDGQLSMDINRFILRLTLKLLSQDGGGSIKP